VEDHSGDGGVDPDVEHETWRQLTFWVAVAEIAVVLGITLINQVVIPPLIVFGVLFVVAIVLLQRPGKAGPVMIGILSALFVLTNVPFVLADLQHPESFFGFFPAAVGVTAGVLGVVAAIGFLRRWSPGTAGRTSAVFGGLVLVALGVSLAATLTLDDDARQDGDVVVTAENAEWDPESSTADPGDVAVFVHNADPYRHTFTVEDLDVDVEIPASTDRRVTFTAEPGEYQLTCEVPGHEDMEGTLTVG
jgi:plastocyanin